MTAAAARHLIVAGAQRSGTTYLYELLDEHPDITMAKPVRPEPKVFLSDDLAARGREWYVETYFAGATGTILGEKSTSYLEDPAAPERIKAVLPDPVIVVQLRDPLARAASNWRFSTDNGFETMSMADAFRLDLAGNRDWDRTRSSVSPFAYLRRGRYMLDLRRCFDAFPGRVHVAFLEETSRDPEAVSRLYAAAGADPGHRPRALAGVVNASTPADETLPADLEAEARAFFADSDAELAATLGRSLPWPTSSHASGDSA